MLCFRCVLYDLSKYWQVHTAESYEDTMRNAGINIEIEACASYILLFPLLLNFNFLLGVKFPAF